MFRFSSDMSCRTALVEVLRSLAKWHWLPATHALAREGQVAALRLLLSAGYPAQATDDGGWTLLHIGASQGDPRIVALARAFGCSPDFAARDGTTPVDIARTKSSSRVLAVLERPAAMPHTVMAGAEGVREPMEEA